MVTEIVTGTEATIHFDSPKCIHSRNCVLSHPDVFVPSVMGEWIHPDAQPVEELMRIGQNCPSDAITVVRATLCRCGQSKNKPYCDGSHKAAGFQA